MSGWLWLTWEDHRRSRELAKEFGAEYVPVKLNAVRPVRYFVLSFRTLLLLIKKRPRLLFCQNPSIVLTSLLVLLKPLFGYILIVDRHSNFKFEFERSKQVKWRVFHFLSRWTIKKADLTIVTNKALSNVCMDLGGSCEILQDKIPDFISEKRPAPKFKGIKSQYKHVMFVTMFDQDEPIKEIIEACKALNGYTFYLTGSYRKMYTEKERNELLAFDIIMTGYVSDDDYLALMQTCDIVVVLTKKDLILNCGAYEAIGLSKPLILSDTPTLRDYFRDSAIYCDCFAESISERISEAGDNQDQMISVQKKTKKELEQAWIVSFQRIFSRLNEMSEMR